MCTILDKKTIDMLRFINDNPKTELEQLYSNFQNTDVEACVELLKNLGYIKGLTPRPYYTTNFFTNETKFVEYYGSPYLITPQGKAYLESKKRHATEIWIPIIISIIALFSSEIISWLIEKITTN